MRIAGFLALAALAFALTLGSPARADESKTGGADAKAAEAAKAPEKAAAATKDADGKGCCCWTTKKTGESATSCKEMAQATCDVAGRAYGNPTKWHAGACTDADKAAK